MSGREVARFVDALGHATATSPPGAPISVEDVARIAEMERTDAIRTGLELIESGLVDGSPLTGDDEIKTTNGLRLTGLGTTELRRQQTRRFLLALDQTTGGDPDAAGSATELGQELGWPDAVTRRVADTLEDDGLIESIEMGSDLVSLTPSGRRVLDRTTNTQEEDMASVSINKTAIAKMMRDIQLEFDKHPIKVPLQSDGSMPAGSTTIYNGPVIHGDATGAQLAWNNAVVNQQRQDQVAPGYEALAQALVSTLEQLTAAGLPEVDQQDAEAAAREALEELTQAQPDRGVVRRAVAALKGHLAVIAAGLSSGAGEGAKEWAKTAIEHLQLPS